MESNREMRARTGTLFHYFYADRRYKRWRNWSLNALVMIIGCTFACISPRYRMDRVKSEVADHFDLEQLIVDGRSKNSKLPEVAETMRTSIVDYKFTEEKDEYRIGANDVLNIFIVGHPEMSSQRINVGEISGTSVQKDGNVYLPVVGRVAAAGKTLIEFREHLLQTIVQFVVEPQLSVEILEFGSQKFYVLGQVNRPGAFPVDGDTSLLEGIGLAGGIVPESGNLEGAQVLRQGKLLPINLADILVRGDVRRNVFMRHGDVVFVPDNSDQQVYVLGEVARPSAIQIRGNRMTLAQALAQAGGPTMAKARKELAVVRGGYAKPRVYRLDLEQALLFDDQILLKSGDRIVVAPTGLATSSRYVEQLLPFLQAAQAAGISVQGATSLANQVAATQ